MLVYAIREKHFYLVVLVVICRNVIGDGSQLHSLFLIYFSNTKYDFPHRPSTNQFCKKLAENVLILYPQEKSLQSQRFTTIFPKGDDVVGLPANDFKQKNNAIMVHTRNTHFETSIGEKVVLAFMILKSTRVLIDIIISRYSLSTRSEIFWFVANDPLLLP